MEKAVRPAMRNSIKLSVYRESYFTKTNGTVILKNDVHKICILVEQCTMQVENPKHPKWMLS